MSQSYEHKTTNKIFAGVTMGVYTPIRTPYPSPPENKILTPSRNKLILTTSAPFYSFFGTAFILPL
jgi:hypothetical protein